MSSSTSSSEPPRGRWGRSWLLAAAIVVIALGCWEGLWRMSGYRPSVADGFALWSRARARASNDSPRMVAFAGSSIVQAAVDLEVFHAVHGGPRPVQLGITGSSALPILEDLAEDPHFRGLVVAEYRSEALLDEGPMQELPRAQIAYHRKSVASPFERVEGNLSGFFGEQMVFRLSALSPRELWRAGWPVRWPRFNPGSLSVDRELVVEYHGRPVSFTPFAKRRRGPADVGALEVNVKRIAAALEKLRSRGADAVFVFVRCRGPEGDDAEARRFALASTLVAQVQVELIDVGTLIDPSQLACPDGTHLEARSRAPFSRALANALER